MNSPVCRDSRRPRCWECGNLSYPLLSPPPSSAWRANYVTPFEPAKLSLGRRGIWNPVPRCVANQHLRPLRHCGSASQIVLIIQGIVPSSPISSTDQMWEWRTTLIQVTLIGSRQGGLSIFTHNSLQRLQFPTSLINIVQGGEGPDWWVDRLQRHKTS